VAAGAEVESVAAANGRRGIGVKVDCSQLEQGGAATTSLFPSSGPLFLSFHRCPNLSLRSFPFFPTFPVLLFSILTDRCEQGKRTEISTLQSVLPSVSGRRNTSKQRFPHPDESEREPVRALIKAARSILPPREVYEKRSPAQICAVYHFCW
jgi:hypothetical protein